MFFLPRRSWPSRVDVFLATTLYFLNVIDCLTTMYVVSQAGVTAELNPLMRLLLSHGYHPFMLLKIIGGLILTVLFVRLSIPRKFSISLSGVTFVYFLYTLYSLFGIWRIVG